MAKHRLDRRKKEGWGGPALISLCRTRAPASHAAEDEHDPTVPFQPVWNDPVGPTSAPALESGAL